MQDESPLQSYRQQYKPKIPTCLQQLNSISLVSKDNSVEIQENLKKIFSHTWSKKKMLSFSKKSEGKHAPKRVGVVLSGGQAAGGHNVICGLFDALKELNSQSQLFGFLNGPKGMIENDHIELTSELLQEYRNTGGFDLLGSGRTKIETLEQFKAVQANAKALNLDGIVIIGGDDSNTNAAFLAEYFIANDCQTVVVGVPKTIDGDLKNEDIEISFGFDSAAKTYSETVGNIMRDACSAKKSYYFIKLMGRTASHITLEVALQTHPNAALISEEVALLKKSLAQLTAEIADIVCKRAEKGKNYGVILIPEGVIEFVPEFKQLIDELNHLFAQDNQASNIQTKLSKPALDCFNMIPKEIQDQLLLDRDPHGNVQVSKIETERLFLHTVSNELKKRASNGTFKGKFNGQPHFCGYEGRSCYPSNFDAQYCNALGIVAALLIDEKHTGYICCVKNLWKPVDEWEIAARALVSMMTTEVRSGKEKPVIAKALVDLNGKLFENFQKMRSQWAIDDAYRYPGPIQFGGPEELTEAVTFTISALCV